MSDYSNTDVISYKYRPRQNLFCVVCSAPAYGMNFNAITCQSCKAFFRRNALKKPPLLRCLKTRSCIIDISSRRNCSFCRLAKCLAAGMNHQLIQTAEAKLRKKQYHLERQQSQNYKPFQLLTKNSFQSLLTNDDRLLLHQICHAYESRTQYFHPLNILPKLLVHNDFNFHISSLPELINTRSITIFRLILFFKLSSSYFQTLNDDDKVTLVKFNIPSLFWINIALFYNPITNTFCEHTQGDLVFNQRNLIDFYGIDIYNRIIKYLCLLHEFIRIDSVIIYLLMLILLFSHFSSCISLAEPILHDYNHIRQAQNLYTTLLVRILMEKVGEQNSSLLLAKLIFICVNIQHVSRDISYIESTQISHENISSLMKVFLII